MTQAAVCVVCPKCADVSYHDYQGSPVDEDEATGADYTTSQVCSSCLPESSQFIVVARESIVMVTKLRLALRKHGQHYAGSAVSLPCPKARLSATSTAPCMCGLDDALKL